MNLKGKIAENWRGGLTCGLITAFAGLLFLTVPPIHLWLENLSYDLSFVFARTSDPAGLVVVERDEKSLRELKQTYERWDRSLYARLLDRLTADQAKLVVLDIFLSDPGPAQADKELAQAIKRNGRVALAAYYQEYQNPNLAGGQAIFPPDEFRDAASDFVGLSVVNESKDRVIRELHCGSEGNPSLAWVAAVKMGAAQSESQRLTERWLRYYRPPDGLPGGTQRISFSDALQQEAGFFRNKYVFVGGKPQTKRQGEEADVFASPYSRLGGGLQSGVTIQAIAFLNLLRGDWLTRMSPVYQLILVLVCGFTAGFSLQLLRPVPGAMAALIGMLLIFAGALALASNGNVWFSWMAIAGAEIPFALGLSVLSHTKRLQREKDVASQLLAREKEIVERLLPDADSVVSVSAMGPGGTVAVADQADRSEREPTLIPAAIRPGNQ